MNRRIAKALTHLYPASWQRRYAEEFSLFLEESDGGIFSVANVISSAIREHIHLQEEQIMNRSQDASGLVVLSFVAAIAGGVNLVMTVDDSALIGAMRLHRSQDVMWGLMAVAAILAGGSALSIAVPLYRSMLLYAHRTHRRDVRALLRAPFIGSATLLLWGLAGLLATRGRWIATPWAILSSGGAPPFWPSVEVRWICGIISVVLVVGAALTSAVSLQQAIRRTDFQSAEKQLPQGKSRSPVFSSLLVTSCTIAMFLSVLMWGLSLQQSSPELFRQHIGILDGTARTSWIVSLCLFGLAGAISFRGSRSLLKNTTE